MVRLLQKSVFQNQNLLHFGVKALTGTATQHTSSTGTTTSAAAKTVPKSENVPGLSSAVYQLAGGDVGPGATKDGQYKNPEYFCYNRMSYFEAEIELSKYRLPQPSNKPKKS